MELVFLRYCYGWDSGNGASSGVGVMPCHYLGF